MPSKYRYPGYRSFSKETKNVFFGRMEDTRKVVDKIDTHNLTILFGRSGDGKSSLINAGIIPAVEDRYTVIHVRFYAFQSKSTSLNPTQVFKDVLKCELGESELFLNQLVQHPEKISAWQYIKSLQLKSVREQKAQARKVPKLKEFRKEDGPELHTIEKNDLIEPENINPRGILLIMDQFEEVFTYPPDEIEEFGQQLSEVLYNRMPSEFQQVLYNKFKDADKLDNDIKEQLRLIEIDSQVKVLIGIRWDKKGHLHKLKSSINFIEQNEYELKPLTTEQATEAIEKPAGLGGEEFKSPPIQYTEEVLSSILDFLSKNNTAQIEAFQLQIICRYIEKEIVTGAGKWQDSERSIFTVASYHGVNKKLFEDVLKNYYEKFINSKKRDKNNRKTNEARFTEFEKLAIRHLIERKLIDPKNKSRKPPVGDVALPTLGIDINYQEDETNDNIISSLITSRLVREEPNTRGGNSYELCHDTMVVPILAQAHQMGDLADKVSSYYDKQIKSASIPEKKLKRFINNHFLSPVKDLERVYRNDLEEDDKAYLDEALKLNLIRKIEPINSETGEEFELYEQFQNAAIASQSEMLRTFNLKNLVTSFLLLVVMGGMLVWSISSNKIANREINLNRGEKVIANVIDSIPDKILALQLLDSIHNKLGDSIAPAVYKKVTQIFKDGHFDGKEIILRGYEILSYEISNDGQWILAKCSPLRKSQDLSASRATLPALQNTYFLYNRIGELKKSFTAAPNRHFRFLDDNQHLYDIKYSGLFTDLVDTVGVISLENPNEIQPSIPVEYPYEVHSGGGNGIKVIIGRPDKPLKIVNLVTRQTNTIKPAYTSFSNYISSNGKHVVFIKKAFLTKEENIFDLELWSVDGSFIKKIIRPGYKVLGCAFYKNSDMFYVTSDSIQKDTGSSLKTSTTKKVSVFDKMGNEVKSFEFENAKRIYPEEIISSNIVGEYYLFTADMDYSFAGVKNDYYLYVFEKDKNSPAFKVPLGQTNAMQTTSVSLYVKNGKTICIPVNTRYYGNADADETFNKNETAISAKSRLFIFNTDSKSLIDSVAFDYAINNTQMSRSGDSIYFGKSDKQGSSVVLMDRKKKQIINEFVSYKDADGDVSLNGYLYYSYYKLPLSKESSLMVLRDAKEKLVVYDLSKPIVNSNNGEEILKWLRSSGKPPLQDSVAEKYLRFRRLIAF